MTHDSFGQAVDGREGKMRADEGAGRKDGGERGGRASRRPRCPLRLPGASQGRS